MNLYFISTEVINSEATTVQAKIVTTVKKPIANELATVLTPRILSEEAPSAGFKKKRTQPLLVQQASRFLLPSRKNLLKGVTQRTIEVGSKRMEEALNLTVHVGDRLQLPAEFLLCGSWVESKFGSRIGSPAAGLIYSHPNRDAVPYYGLAKKFGKNPYAELASEALSYGYGSALGWGQILPSNFSRLSGLEFKYKKLFSDDHKEYTIEDIMTIQRIVNKHFGRAVVTVDGHFGSETLHWVKEYIKEIDPRAPLKYVRIDKGFMKAFFTVQAGYTCSYDSKKDQIAAALGVAGPLNPWDPTASLTAMGLMLKENNVLIDQWYAYGAYFAGPSRARGTRGKDYARKNLSLLLWATKEVDRYFRQNIGRSS